MTNEEAIRIIKIVIAIAEDFEIIVQGEEFTEEKCKEAVEIASKALEQTRWIPVNKRLPEEATNGDIIKAMFPYGEYGTNGNDVHVFGVGGNGVLVFTQNWWNAPYKVESEE